MERRLLKDINVCDISQRTIHEPIIKLNDKRLHYVIIGMILNLTTTRKHTTMTLAMPTSSMVDEQLCHVTFYNEMNDPNIV